MKNFLVKFVPILALIMAIGWGYLAYRSKVKGNSDDFKIDLIISGTAAVAFILSIIFRLNKKQ